MVALLLPVAATLAQVALTTRRCHRMCHASRRDGIGERRLSAAWGGERGRERERAGESGKELSCTSPR
jgi:hypothetical protein